MKSEQLGSKDISAALDITWELDNVCTVGIEDFFVCPLLLRVVVAIALDFEELHVLDSGFRSGDQAEILHGNGQQL